ncbi:MAG: hypothetical protein AAFV53_20375 [Myxococcota bacterium]
MIVLLWIGCAPSEYEFVDVVPDLVEDMPAATAPIYFHTPQSLWAWDPADPEPWRIGTFLDPDDRPLTTNISDIAIDEEGRIFGCGGGAFFRIDPETALAVGIASSPAPMVGLAFREDGVLLGAGEDIYVIHPRLLTIIETFGSSSDINTIGDVVEGFDGNLIWSVRHERAGRLLIEMHPKSGAILAERPLDASQTYGLAALDETVYAFTRAGNAFTIDHDTGEILARQFSSALEWWGASQNPAR